MDGDLLQYREKYREKFQNEGGVPCFNELAVQLLQGLRCLHVSGYVHLDFKSLNAMFKEDPSEDCSRINVRVADFGLSKHFADPQMFCYTEEQYKTYTYLPRSIFDVPTEVSEHGTHAAHLVPSFCDKNNSVFVPGYGQRPVVTVSTQIDWCTYVYTMRKFKPDFAERCEVAATEEDSEKLIELNCGPMGEGRTHELTYCGVFDGVDRAISPKALGGVVPVDMRYGLDLAVIRPILAGFQGVI
jgi:serine/threonine protein kinase